MKAPFLLLGTALLVWGWQVQQLALAIGLAVVLESARFLHWRWHIGDKEINRIVDLCGFGLAVLVVYCIAVQPLTLFILEVLKWLPVVLFPLLLIQRYTDHERLPWTALSLQQRRRGRSQRSVNIDYPYFVGLLIAASTGNHSPMLFFPVVVVLWAWAIWTQRNPRFRPLVWLLLVGVAGAGGFTASEGLDRTQQYLEEHAPLWLIEWFYRHSDPYQRSTALGAIGRLKLSSRILLRVSIDAGKAPLLLRTAGYNRFIGGNTWLATERKFEDIERPGALRWRLHRAAEHGAGRVRIQQTLSDGTGMLPLPLGSRTLDGIAAERITRNALGSVKVQDAPALIDYRVFYEPGGEAEYPPPQQWCTDSEYDPDCEIPKNYRPLLAEIAAESGIANVSVGAAVRVVHRLQNFFRERFEYSLDLIVLDADLPPLLDFLSGTRAGHCEYFASATVLLLRQAGIPARYASGFSVQEYSELEDRYIVRQRHAHAWAIAWIDGRWRNVDTTPPVWATAEAQHAAWLTPVYDFFSWAWLKLTEWRMRIAEEDQRNQLALLLIPLILVLLWRLRKQQRIRKRRAVPPDTASGVGCGAGQASACYRIVDWYLEQGWKRVPGETLTAWFARIEAQAPAGRRALLAQILELHYRYRFDPMGLDAAGQRSLQVLVSVWFGEDRSIPGDNSEIL